MIYKYALDVVGREFMQTCYFSLMAFGPFGHTVLLKWWCWHSLNRKHQRKIHLIPSTGKRQQH